MFVKMIFILLLDAIYSISIDTPNMINFARALGIQSKQPAIWSQLLYDCCTADSVSCTNQRVIDIEWYNMGLNGTINGTAIPSSLNYLALWGNKLTGSIPTSLPSGLINLNVDNNKLTGGIPSTLPIAMTNLYVYGNQLGGDLPSFLPTLRYLALGFPGISGNHFTGTLRMNAPAGLYLNYNWITDVIIQDSGGLSGNCDISHTPLLGNPRISNLAMCTQNGLYSASALPNSLKTTFETTVTAFKWTSVDLTTTLGLFNSSYVAQITTKTEMPLLTTETIEPRSSLMIEASSKDFLSTTYVDQSSSNVVLATSNIKQKTTNLSHSSTVNIFKSTTTRFNKSKTTIISKFQFELIVNPFVFNLLNVFRLIFSTMVFTFVVTKTPFKRGLKSLMNAGDKKDIKTLSSMGV